MKCIQFETQENCCGYSQDGIVAIFSDHYPDFQILEIVRDLKNKHRELFFSIRDYEPEVYVCDPQSIDDINFGES